MHSSVAFVLFVISLTAAGLVGLPLALTLVLGANVGGGLVALGLAFEQPIAARRVIYGNLGFRAIGALVAFSRSGRSPRRSRSSARDPGRLAAHFHTLFNLALALVFLPLTGRAARLLERLSPRDARAGPRGAAARPPRPGAARQPAAGAERRHPRDARPRRQGRADAARGDTAPSTTRDGRRTHEVAALEDEVDAGAGGDQALPRAADAARADAARRARGCSRRCASPPTSSISATSSTRACCRLAAKKQKQGLRFSDDGWRDIQRLPRADRRADAPGARGLRVARHPRSPASSSPRRTGCATRRRGPPSATSAGCATACPRRSRPARCTSTCCATSSGSTPT